MGFFDFFKKKEQVEVYAPNEIKFSELENWLTERKKEESAKLNSQISEISKEFSLEKSKLLQNLAILETAQITNPNILERAKHIMDGNRSTYLEKIRSFIDKHNFPTDPDHFADFISSFDSDLANLDKSVAKSHTILLEFFNEKSTAVQISLRNLDKLVKNTQKIIENSRLPLIQKVEEKRATYAKQIEQSSQEKELFKKAEKEIDSFSKSILAREFELDKIKESVEFKTIKQKITQKEDNSKSLENVSSKISSLFSEIEPALKKYENLSKNSLVKDYLENPPKALVSDEKLEIIQIIEAARKAMIMNQIILNDKKKNRVFNQISSITPETISQLAQQKKELMNSVSTLESEITSSEVLKKAESIEKSLIPDKAELERQKKNFDKAKTKLHEPNFLEIKSELQNEINQKLNRIVRINF